MDTTFRIARPEELETVLQLIREYFTYDGIRFDELPVRAGLTELLTHSELGWAFVAQRSAERGGSVLADGSIDRAPEIVGYAVATVGFDLEFGGRQATLTDLYLVPAARRQGLGRGLLAFVEETARQSGARALELQVEQDNPEASALYSAAGFTPHTRVPMSKPL